MTIKKYHFDDLTKINTAIGLLDDETLARLQAHDGGYEYFSNDMWLGIGSLAGMPKALVIRAKPIPVTQDHIPWAHIDKRIQWAARDEIGTAVGFESEPKVSGLCWLDDRRNDVRIDGVFADYRPGTCDWRDSLQKRPDGV